MFKSDYDIHMYLLILLMRIYCENKGEIILNGESDVKQVVEYFLF